MQCHECRQDQPVTHHIRNGRLLCPTCADGKPRAIPDALALWSVRVLWLYDVKTGKATRWEPFMTGSGRGEACPNNGIRYSGDNRELAWIAAADAVKHELGDRCPRRPV